MDAAHLLPSDMAAEQRYQLGGYGWRELVCELAIGGYGLSFAFNRGVVDMALKRDREAVPGTDFRHGRSPSQKRSGCRRGNSASRSSQGGKPENAGRISLGGEGWEWGEDHFAVLMRQATA